MTNREPTARLPWQSHLARWILRLLGWKLELNLPESPRYVLIGAPHTSNKDGVLAVLLKYAADIPMHFIGKETLFRPPFGIILRWLGGIPVNRSSTNNFVDQMVEIFDHQPRLVLAIAPEGTRSKVTYWRTGFYFMALGAKVPIAFGYIDQARRILGIAPGFIPTGDLSVDMEPIRQFYAQHVQLYRNGHRQIQLKEQAESASRPEEILPVVVETVI